MPFASTSKPLKQIESPIALTAEAILSTVTTEWGETPKHPKLKTHLSGVTKIINSPRKTASGDSLAPEEFLTRSLRIFDFIEPQARQFEREQLLDKSQIPDISLIIKSVVEQEHGSVSLLNFYRVLISIKKSGKLELIEDLIKDPVANFGPARVLAAYPRDAVAEQYRETRKELSVFLNLFLLPEAIDSWQVSASTERWKSTLAYLRNERLTIAGLLAQAPGNEQAAFEHRKEVSELLADGQRGRSLDQYCQLIRSIFSNSSSLWGAPALWTCRTASWYDSKYGLKQGDHERFVKHVLPLLDLDSPQTTCLSDGDARSEVTNGVGLADWTCFCLLKKANRQNLWYNLSVLKLVPGTSHSRMDQNRRDAIFLGPAFNILRNMVHQQRPKVHDHISALLKWYDTGDAVDLNHQLATLVDYADDQSGALRAELFKPKNYNKPAFGKEPNIDLLRRLYLNTKPVQDAQPLTDSEPWDLTIAAMEGDLKTLSEADFAKKVQKISDMIAIELSTPENVFCPNQVLSIAWASQKIYQWMAGLCFEQQAGLHKSDSFKEILRFQDLVANPAKEQQRSRGLEVPIISRDGSWSTELRRAGRWTISRLLSMQNILKQEGQQQLIDSTWTGNIDFQLLYLAACARPAETRVGERYAKEAMQPDWKISTGD